ncbi:MAG: CoA pyrophosphatase [Chloroflexota bacterium]|nr:CoA pyrophosphatase [Chloroflexota bacterium]
MNNIVRTTKNHNQSTHMDLTEEQITHRLDHALKTNLPPEFPYTVQPSKNSTQLAAVLIPFLRAEGEWHLLLIRRTLHPKDRHGGQVAFPGGRRDHADPNAETTALREAQEEIGLRPKDVRILGQLRDLITITNYRVTPMIGAISWPYNVHPQPEEVSRIFTMPLKWLADPVNRETRQNDFLYQGKPCPVIYFQPYNGEILWGASARMVMLLLEALGLSTPDERYKPKHNSE